MNSCKVSVELEVATAMLCKVYPSPGAARSVWGLQATGHSCNMVSEHSAATVREEKDASIICCSDGATFHLGQDCKSIFDVVRTGELIDIEALVEKLGSEALSSRDQWGYTPAHWAALDGNLDVMRYLVERSVPVDLPCLGTQGPRPIHWACRKGHVAVVQVLLQRACLDARPLQLTCWECKRSTISLTSMETQRCTGQHTRVSDATFLDTSKSHPELIRLLMYSGVDLQKPDNFGSTPLHLACLSGNVNCVKMLCEKSKIELEPRDKNGKTPLMLAKSHRHNDVVTVLTAEYKRRASWIVANRRDPGCVALNTESYHRAIRQIPYYDKWKQRNMVLSRLCHTCRCLRPLRAKHCRICNRCVQYFDHHCPFIYNCVGLRNRMWFFMFVVSIAINCSYTIYFACYCIALEGWEMMYILGLIEALVFSGLGWILTCTSVSHAKRVTLWCANLQSKFSMLQPIGGANLWPKSRL
ncbi:hypothetical protein B566_EDAN009032 [Ephemera danica]|nr:hypothetical protein B566_EDAN009032 [Ephemera danica]